MTMKNIFDLKIVELQSWMEYNGEKGFRAKQVFDWIYKGTLDFMDMVNIPLSLRNKLKSNFAIDLPEIIKSYKSNLDDTVKMLLKYQDGNVIETVIMKYKYGNTVCVSSQIGCGMGCKFCASTINGVVRSLTAGEILGQVIVAGRFLGERISNVVIMGSGEPLVNYDNVLKFIEIVNWEQGLNIGQRHITLSTCGIVPKIHQLAEENLQITLAISLHSPWDEERKKIMPIANEYSIIDIVESCKYYINITGRRITFEYALINNVNDRKEDAEQLIKLLKGMLCHVNLIPMNEVKESSFKKSSVSSIQSFQKKLEEGGIDTTIRRELGADINAACGQLRKSYIENNID
jgi:23S rRNA (adenine2503-C2)-methyltransferase